MSYVNIVLIKDNQIVFKGNKKEEELPPKEEWAANGIYALKGIEIEAIDEKIGKTLIQYPKFRYEEDNSVTIYYINKTYTLDEIKSQKYTTIQKHYNNILQKAFDTKVSIDAYTISNISPNPEFGKTEELEDGTFSEPNFDAEPFIDDPIIVNTLLVKADTKSVNSFKNRAEVILHNVQSPYEQVKDFNNKIINIPTKTFLTIVENLSNYYSKIQQCKFILENEISSYLEITDELLNIDIEERFNEEINKHLEFEALKEHMLHKVLKLSNLIKIQLSEKYSTLEEATWPEQEAGARAILNDEDNVKNMNAGLILSSETLKNKAIELVNQLALADNSPVEEFANRIVTNANLAHQYGILTLLEQRGMETAIRNSTSIAELENLQLSFSLLTD